MQGVPAVGNGATGIVAQPRLVRAAHEFEAQMMKELLKPLTEGGTLFAEDGGEASGGALGEFASESLGRAMSERGGLGIANRIVAEFSRSGTNAKPGKESRIQTKIS